MLFFYASRLDIRPGSIILMKLRLRHCFRMLRRPVFHSRRGRTPLAGREQVCYGNTLCESGGIGRRTGLRIQHHRYGGSTPPSRTITPTQKRSPSWNIALKTFRRSEKKSSSLRNPRKLKLPSWATIALYKTSVQVDGSRKGKDPDSVSEQRFRDKITTKPLGTHPCT